MHGRSRRLKSFQINGFLWPGEQLWPTFEFVCQLHQISLHPIPRAPAGAMRNSWPAEGQSPHLYRQCKAWTRSHRITIVYMRVLITWKVSNHSVLRKPGWDIAVPRNLVLWVLNDLTALECLLNHNTILSKPPNKVLLTGEKKPLLYWAKKCFLISGQQFRSQTQNEKDRLLKLQFPGITIMYYHCSQLLTSFMVNLQYWQYY